MKRFFFIFFSSVFVFANAQTGVKRPRGVSSGNSVVTGYTGSNSLTTFPAVSANAKPSVSTVAPGAAFNINAGGSTSGSSPVVSWSGTHDAAVEAGAGDYFSLTGESLTGSTLKVWDGKTLYTSAGNILNRVGTFKNPVPSGHGFAVGWLDNGLGKSAPFVFNKAKPTWCDDKVYPNDTAYLYGYNLSKDNGTNVSHIYLVKDGVTTKIPTSDVVDVNPYRVGFKVSSIGSNYGTYEVWVHNESGGDYGFEKCPTNLQIDQWVNWANATVVTISGLSTAMTLAAAQANKTAIVNALSVNGTAATPRKIKLPAGAATYYISDGFGFGENVWFDGNGINSTSIKLLPYSGVSDATEAQIIAARSGDGLVSVNNHTRMTNMTISTNQRRLSNGGQYEPVFRNVVIGFQKEDVRIEKVKIDARGTFAPEICFKHDQGDAKNIQINDCEILQSNGLYLQGTFIHLKRNVFRGVHSINQAVDWMVRNGSFVGNEGRNYGTTLAEKAKGRLIVMKRPSRDCYVADSKTFDYSPPGPDSGLDITPLDESAWGYKPNTSTTSTTSLSITSGAKTLFVGTGLSITADDWVHILYSVANGMLMDVWSYNSSTGQLDGYVTPTNKIGSGTYSNWTVAALWMDALIDYDDNAGEQHLIEGFAAQWKGTGATVPVANQITLPSGATGKFDTDFSSGIRTAQHIYVAEGQGKGQLRKIISVSGLTATLESNWKVQPNSSSVIVLMNASTNMVFYNLTDDGNDRALTGDHKATTSIEPYGGTFAMIADKVTATRMRFGLVNYAFTDAVGFSPHAHHVWKNLNFNNCYQGVRMQVDLGSGETQNAPGFLGMIYRNITVTGSSNSNLSIINSSTTAPFLMSGMVFEEWNFLPGTSWPGVENLITE